MAVHQVKIDAKLIPPKKRVSVTMYIYFYIICYNYRLSVIIRNNTNNRNNIIQYLN